MTHIATKAFAYRGIRRESGEIMTDLSARDARVLLAIGKVAAVDPLSDLRALAALEGIYVDGRWGAERINAEIDAARKRKVVVRSGRVKD